MVAPGVADVAGCSPSFRCVEHALLARLAAEIAPEQIGDYETRWHRRQLRRWLESGAAPHGLTLDAARAIREARIAAIARADAAAR